MRVLDMMEGNAGDLSHAVFINRAGTASRYETDVDALALTADSSSATDHTWHFERKMLPK